MICPIIILTFPILYPIILNPLSQTLENVFSGAIENTIQDLSNNNINAEICYEFLFPPSQ